MIMTHDQLDEAGKRALVEFSEFILRIRKKSTFQEMGFKQAHLMKYL